jgi:hypothetical protein
VFSSEQPLHIIINHNHRASELDIIFKMINPNLNTIRVAGMAASILIAFAVLCSVQVSFVENVGLYAMQTYELEMPLIQIRQIHGKPSLRRLSSLTSRTESRIKSLNSDIQPPLRDKGSMHAICSARAVYSRVMGARGMVCRLRGGSDDDTNEDWEYSQQETSGEPQDDSESNNRRSGGMNLTALLAVKRSRELKENEWALENGIDFEATNKLYLQALKEEAARDDTDYRNQVANSYTERGCESRIIIRSRWLETCRCQRNTKIL